MEIEALSQPVEELVEYATVSRPQVRQVRRNAKKLYTKQKLRHEFQYGLKEGLTLISYAAARGHQLLLDILLDTLHVDPNITQSLLQTTPLHHAAANGQDEIVNSLVIRYMCPLDVVDACGSTPLYLAMMRGRIKTSLSLIELGASVLADNFYGAPLHLAAFCGYLSVVEVLCEKSPQIIGRELYGFCTPIVAAMCGSSMECVQHLAQLSSVQHLAYKAIACSSTEAKALECIGILSDRGMDPNIHDKALLEETPILLAARRGWRQVVQLLLPLSSQMDEVSWSVDGLLQYVQSEQFKAMEKEQTEFLRVRCIEELRNRHFLASEYILKVLGIGMAHEDLVLLRSLHRILVSYANASVPLQCDDAIIRQYGLTFLNMGSDQLDDALQAAEACLALNHDAEANQDFMMECLKRKNLCSCSTSEA